MGLDRRGFIKFAAGGAIGTLFTPIPWKLTDDLSIWTQNWPWVPRNIKGNSAYVSTVSKMCPSGCGLSVRTVGGLPVRTLGDPNNPLSGGKITSLAAAEVQLLYSSARLKRPLRKSDDGSYVAISWDEAKAILEEKLGSIKGVKGKLACVSGDENGTINEVLSGFVKKAGSEDFFSMPCDAQVSSRSWEDIMGGSGQLGYDIENSDYVLALGADMLESWGTIVRNRRAFSDSHPNGEDATAKYVYAGSVQNNTAAGADQWIPCKPGSQVIIALGLANLLIEQGAQADASDFGGFKTLAAKYTPEAVQKATGVTPKQLKALAKELKAASKPLVITGSEFTQGEGAATVMAGIALNMLLSGINKPGGLTTIPDVPKVVKAAPERKERFSKDFVAYLAQVAKGKATPEALVIYEANPVYALPDAAATTAALKKIPFKVTFTSFLDETAMACDLILPQPMGLERYDDVVTPYGCGTALYTGCYPVIKPLVNAKHAGDVMLTVAAKLGMDLGFGTFKEVLDAKAKGVGVAFDDLQGKYVKAESTASTGSISLKPEIIEQSVAKSPKGDLALAPIFKLNFGTGSVATPPFNLKTVRDTELLGNDSFVQLNGATAAKKGVQEGDFVKLTNSKGGECVARVHIYEGVMNDVVAAPMGLGHTAFDEFTKDKGSNISSLLTATTEPGTGISVWADNKVKIAKI